MDMKGPEHNTIIDIQGPEHITIMNIQGPEHITIKDRRVLNTLQSRIEGS